MSLALRGPSACHLSGRRPFGLASPLPARKAAALRSAQLTKTTVQCRADQNDPKFASKVAVPLAAALAAGLVLMPAAFPEAAEVRLSPPCCVGGSILDF